MPDTPTILLSKKARGRVHPTRALPPKKRPTRWALSLAEAARDVVASLGAGPAAYAEKHAPAALPAMREVSAALWPDGEGAKTPAFAPARLEALLYRCFHIDVDAELFVQTWLDRGGVSLAVDVLFELDSFDAVLCWQRSSSSYAEGRSPLAAITLERREVDGAYQHLAARNEHYTAPAGTLHHAPARHLR
ncbi:MAG: hypothetical protein KC503_00795, partial [Myxococcales bacterium]|nr:hypothetical protein [Myxococcales bacterium]